MNNKLKKIISTTILTILPLSFIACGGGGGDASFKNSETLVSIDVNCTAVPTPVDIATYIDLNSGDVIVQDDANTTIKTYHDINGTKKVCLVSGTAHIIRK